ncbi:MAG: hypothetical protein LBQ42_06625 [Synergistaceae bacterium]|jgi:hypothetical protein|nr:hypothetical protein [Synergistaceae bacterium]
MKLAGTKSAKGFLWRFAVCAALFVALAASTAFAAEETYVLEGETVYRVRDGKKTLIENAEVRSQRIDSGAGGGIFWFTVDSQASEVMAGSKSGVYFFDDKGKALRFLPYDYAFTIGDIVFSDDGKQMVLDTGTWIVRVFFLYDFESLRQKAEFTGMGQVFWLDGNRFAFTMVEPDAEPRPSATDFDGWTSVVAFDTLDGRNVTIPVMKATETQNYLLTGVNPDKRELQITESSVKDKKDWVDMEKVKDKELSVPYPATGDK